MMLRPSEIHTRPFSSPIWYLLFLFSMQQPGLIFVILQHKNATESDLRREFEGYGTIERVRVIRDKKGRSRGYAFIVYERERDMKG